MVTELKHIDQIEMLEAEDNSPEESKSDFPANLSKEDTLEIEEIINEARQYKPQDMEDLMAYAGLNVAKLYLLDIRQFPLFENQQVMNAHFKALSFANRILAMKNAPENLKVPIHQNRTNIRAGIIQRNTRLAVSVARRYQDRGLPFPDLLQAANIGLIQAVDKFDHERKVTFATYGVWWIRQEVGSELKKHGRTVRIPFNSFMLLRHLYEISDVMTQELNRIPTNEELAQEANKILPSHMARVTAARIGALFNANTPPISTTALTSNLDSDSETLIQNLIPDLSINVAESVIDLQQRARVIYKIRTLVDECLTGRMRDIVKLRYGLMDGKYRSHEEVGRIVRNIKTNEPLSRQRVEQLEAKALGLIHSFNPAQFADLERDYLEY